MFILSASLFLIVGLLPSLFYRTMDISSYLTFHMVVETFSIIVSFSIFGVGYYTYNQSHNRYALFLSCAFLSIGLIDMIHMLSFPGMPAFITPNSTNKGILFWISARLITAIALIVSVYIYADTEKWWLSKKYLLPAALIISALVFAVAIYYPSNLPQMFIEGSGLTTTKVVLEWLVIALIAIAFILYWRRFKKTSESFIILILAALILCIFSELSFTIYESAFDTFNMLGHIYKLIAFIMIYAGIFFVTITEPYHKLEKEMIEREKAEENIRMLANVVESSDDAIITLSLKGCITSWNKGAEAIYGYSEKEIMGEDISILAMPELKNETKKLIEKIKHNEHLVHHESVRVRKDGSKIDVSLTLSPIFDISGTLVGISTIARDITQRKRAEIEVRESEEFLDNIVENIPNMIFVKNAKDLTFKRVNKAGELYFGYPNDELVGKSDYDFFPKDIADFFTKKDCEVLQSKQPLDIPEETIETQELGPRLLHTRKIPIFIKEGYPQYLLGISEDITEFKQAENDLKESLRVKEVLLREIHHRVKNNMQIISSMLNLQCMYVGDDEVAMIALKNSDNRVQSMAMIHESIYDSPDLSRIDFEEYIRKIVTYLYNTYQTQRTQVKTVIDVEDVKFNIETAVPCGLVISELVSNSLKHAFPEGKKGEILVSLHSSDDTYQLTISDNGIGLPEDSEIDKINSFGLELVNILVNQIDGKLSLDKSHGTQYALKFKELEYKTRF